MLNNDNILRMSLKGPPAPIFPFLWLLGCFLCHDCRLLVFKDSMELKQMGRVGILQVKIPQFSVPTKIQPFFINKCSWDYCNPLVNFQNPENINFGKHLFFTSFSIALVEEVIFQRSLFYHFCWHHPPFCTKVNYISTRP